MLISANVAQFVSFLFVDSFAVRKRKRSKPNSFQFIANLFSSLRVGLISLSTLNNKIKSHPLVKENQDCRSIIEETVNIFYDLNNQQVKHWENFSEVNKDMICTPSKMSSVNHRFFRPRHAHETLFAFGGWSGGSATNILEAYDVRSDKWHTISTDHG